MSEDVRERVVAEAWTWHGTRYHHHARLKGVGVDCAQLLAAVYEAVGVVGPIELEHYPTQWHLHHSQELFLEWLERLGAQRLPEGVLPQPGDIGVWQFGQTHSHGGIVVEGGADPLILHAYIRRSVIASRTSEAPLQGVPVCYWGIVKGGGA